MATVEAPPGGQIVLLCGIGGDAGAWTPIGIKGRVHLYPGLGGRKRDPRWSFKQIADEVAAAFEGPLDLIGQSQGARVAESFLIHHPDRVRSAVLSCASFHVAVKPADDPNRPISILHGVVSAETRQRVIDRAKREGMAAIVDTFIERWFTRPAIQAGHPGVAYLRGRLISMGADAFGDQYFAMDRSETITAEQLATVRQPVTCIAGMEDRSSGLFGPATLHRLIPNSRLEILPGGHFNYLEEPGAFAAAIARHFAWVQKGGGRNEFVWRPEWGDRLEAPPPGAGS